MKLLFCFLFLAAVVNSKTLSFTKLSINIFGEHKLEEPKYKVLPNPVNVSWFGFDCNNFKLYKNVL